MVRANTAAWIVSLCAAYIRLSQAKTLGVLVAAAMRCQRMSLANLGRQMAGSAKHQIKRAWRFCDNDRVEVSDAMRGLVGKLIKKRKMPLLVAWDWVDIKGYQTLVASAVLKGRSVPLCWASCIRHVFDGHRSRNAFEESLLLVLRSMIPTDVKVILLGDRGFGRCALAKFCQRYDFHYLIRIQPKVKVKCKGFHGNLLDYPVHKGIARVLKDVDYRSDGAVTHNIVVRWKKNLPAKRDECWFLMTDLGGSAHQLCVLYARRMTIEQLFRDNKSKRNGWSLRDTMITKPQRLDRLLLILAIAYLLLCGIGLLAEKSHKASEWCSNNRKSECSIFTIGLIMLSKCKTSPPQAFIAVLELSLEVVEKWG